MTIYLYDGTWEAFLTLLYKLSFERSDNLSQVKVCNLRLHRRSALSFFGEKIEASAFAINKLKEHINTFGKEQLLKDLYYWYLCDRAGLEIPLAKCLRELERDSEIFQRPHIIEAVRLQKAKRALFRERHRWLGFLRFYSQEKGFLFAQFEPENNVLPLIGGHFLKRFPMERIMIVDTLRGLLFLGQKGKYHILFLEDWEIDLKALKDPFVELWRTYFKEIAVPERVNFERQKGRVPLKVRAFLPEFRDE